MKRIYSVVLIGYGTNLMKGKPICAVLASFDNIIDATAYYDEKKKAYDSKKTIVHFATDFRLEIAQNDLIFAEEFNLDPYEFC